MSLPTYDWYALAASDTREMAAKEQAGVHGSTALGASVAIALLAIFALFVLGRVL